MTDRTDDLPPLPEPALHTVEDENGVSVYPAFYTADQMRAYRAEGVAAEREACAKVCDGVGEVAVHSSTGERRRGAISMSMSCAAAIRARGTNDA